MSICRPGYNPGCSYPLIVYLHVANVDEHYFVGSKLLTNLDDMIVQGKCPPVVVACPDGVVWRQRPVLRASFAVRQRQRRTLRGSSLAGGDPVLEGELFDPAGARGARAARDIGRRLWGDEHGDSLSSIASARSRLRGRPSTCGTQPSITTTSRTLIPPRFAGTRVTIPDAVIGVFYHGLRRSRASRYIGPVFGDGDEVVAKIISTNPADLLTSTGLRSGRTRDLRPLRWPGRI